MAKVNGLGWTTCNVDNASGTPQDLRNDFTNIQFATPMNLQEVTGLDKAAVERIGLLRDFTGTAASVFNPSANKVHAVMSGDLTVIRTLGLVVAAATLNNEVLFSEYNLTRAATGEFTGSHPFSLADGTVPTWS
ncbi:MAG TPA: hypothetical protein VMP68_08945 [Candidatus Eisenbacteria bacterium]|nr:hypothetical protein [Candidatus Eisenbacteria bacterium]